jgi:hypothetical protein
MTRFHACRSQRLTLKHHKHKSENQLFDLIEAKSVPFRAGLEVYFSRHSLGVGFRETRRPCHNNGCYPKSDTAIDNQPIRETTFGGLTAQAREFSMNPAKAAWLKHLMPRDTPPAGIVPASKPVRYCSGNATAEMNHFFITARVTSRNASKHPTRWPFVVARGGFRPVQD